MTVWNVRTDHPDAGRYLPHLLSAAGGDHAWVTLSENAARVPAGFRRGSRAWPALVLGRPAVAAYAAAWGPQLDFVDLAVALLGRPVHRRESA